MERNLRVIPIHWALAHGLVWIPVFVLFTRRHHGLDGALALAATYYLAAVVLEVPSGWLSDRIGRVPTLRLGALAWIVAHIVFLGAGSSFAAVAAGQCLMALGFAAQSGTDVALHYDTLEALDREDEYEDRQSRVAARGYLSATAGTVVGGLLGLVDLRLAFAAALVLAVVQFGAASLLVEPPVQRHADPFHRQLRQCFELMGQRFLGWILVSWVAMVILEHVAFTLSQPYLTEALHHSTDDLGSTPMVVGLQFAASSMIGAGAARVAPRVRRRLGLPLTLFLLGALSAAIVTVMGAVVHAAVIGLLALRSVQGAAGPVLMTAAVAPRVAAHRRATYFSVHSLAGRLAYSGVLFGVAAAVGDELSASLRALSVVAWTVLLTTVVAHAAMGQPAAQGSYDS